MTLLVAREISVRLGGRTILDNVAVTLPPNEFVALVGPNGAGKTTLIKALAGLIPCFGKVEIEGRDRSTMKARERAKALAYLPQGHDFSWPLPAAEIVALGRFPHADPFSPVTPEDRDAVTQALELTGTKALATRIVTTLSGGERARIALARVLATQARIVLADEPTMSLDPRHQFVVMEILRHTARLRGAALAVVHDLSLAARYADRVMILEKGRIVAEGRPAETLTPDRIAKIFGVEADMVTLGGATVPLVRRAL
jgi:iron complex transport system ATP-binding protein